MGDLSKHRAAIRRRFSQGGPSLAITAQYTSAVWAWGRLPCSELFATVEAQRVFDVTNAALAAASVLRPRTPLRIALLHRHAMIDHLVRDAAPQRVLELAAGLSRRGAAFSADASVHYTELDLPAVVAHKRELLARSEAGRAVLARDNYALVAGDALTAELPASDVVIAEGLAMYLDAPARARLFAKARGAAELFVFDLTPLDEEPPPGLAGRALEAAMKRFTGGRAFERDARTREQILGELRAAGFAEVAAIGAADVARAWQLPHAELAIPRARESSRAAPPEGGAVRSRARESSRAAPPEGGAAGSRARESSRAATPEGGAVRSVVVFTARARSTRS